MSLYSSGILSFYSYRDPNYTETLDVFDQTLNWLEKGSFNTQDIDEAKLGIFQSLDKPVVPGARGMREFLTGVSYETFNKHREALRNVTADDVIRVADKYLAPHQTLQGISVIGPYHGDLDSSWTVKKIV